MTIERKCHRDGCTAGARFEVHVSIPCPQPGGVKHLIGAKSSIEVCDRHNDLDVLRAYVLSPENRKSIADSLTDNGYHEPDWLNTRLELRPIELPLIKVIQPCNREGCSGHGKWRVLQKFREIGKSKATLQCDTGLVVCDLHRAITRPADTMTDRAKTFEGLQKAGMIMPDLDKTELEFVPV